jgi:hypothetical protein
MQGLLESRDIRFSVAMEIEDIQVRVDHDATEYIIYRIGAINRVYHPVNLSSEFYHQ